MNRRWFAALLALSCLQLVAVVTGSTVLRAVALASVASPLPKVFTAHAGLEGFSSRYLLTLRDANGEALRITLTPALYAKLRGPYNRRNPYGAVVAGGPVLLDDPRTRALFTSVARYALCGEATMLRELGVPRAYWFGPHTLRHEPRPGTATGLALRVEVTCP